MTIDSGYIPSLVCAPEGYVTAGIRTFVTTIYDVARVAGVSTATVSRVLRGSDLVRADTRQRVLAVIEALGFIPDASARGLAGGGRASSPWWACTAVPTRSTSSAAA